MAGARVARIAITAGAVELGRVELALIDAPVIERAQSQWLAFDLGAHAGGLFPPSDGERAISLGNPGDPGDAVSGGALVGVRAGLFPTRRFGIESEVSLVRGGYAERSGSSILAVGRVQLAARLVEERLLGLRFLAGVDLLGVLGEQGSSTRDAMGGVHYGAAFTVEARRDLWFRLQAIHLVTGALDAGYAHCVEVQLGVVTRFGRRDRW
jgi:hypothetical protein